jgi:DNA-binding CsgD family transcriptional regulator
MPRPAPQHRDALALLADMAGDAQAGAGRVVLLRGATGTGRTTVLEAAAEAAAARGMRVLRARCSPADAGVPFAAVRQVLGGCGPTAGSVPLDAAGSGSTAAGPGRALSEREQADRLWEELRAHAARTPLFIAVDDVHLADAPSHRWFVEAARQVDRIPALLAVTERGQYDVDPPRAGFAHTLSPALVRTRTLPLLTAPAADALVRSAFPHAPEAWVERCARAGTGSPLLLRALLRDLGDVDGLRDAGQVDDGRLPAVPETCAALYPAGYPAAVSWWLDSAGPATAELARALAALDEGWERRPASLPGGDDLGRVGGLARILAETVGADLARVSGWLTAMTGLGLLRRDRTGRLRYAHPLLRDAVLTGVPAARRHAAQRSAAEAMLRCGAPSETVARQLLPAAPVGAEWALTLLRDAAAAALRDGRTEDAIAFLRRTLDEPLAGDERQRLLTRLGSLEYTARRSSVGIRRLTEALRLPGASQDRADAAVALGTALAGHGKPRAAVKALRALDGQLADRPDLAGTLLAVCALLSEQDRAARREVYTRLRDTADRSPELVGPAGQALLVGDSARAGLISADDAMKRLRVLLAEPVHPLTESIIVGAAAAVAQWADELDEAERLVRGGLARQRPDLLHPMREALLTLGADITAARGDHARLSTAPAATGAAPTRAHALAALVESGRMPEAQRLADALEEGEAGDSCALKRFLHARGALRAAAGDPAGALHDFLECGRRQSASGTVSPAITPWRTAAAECHLALGDRRRALVLAQEELRLAEVWGTPRTVGRALRVMGTATGGRRGLELAEESVRLLRGSPAEAELTEALIAQGRQLTAAGKRADARVCLRDAAERAERLAAVRLLTLAERALREGGARRVTTARTGFTALTGSEHRIADLAAQGRTNPEIADLLHLARRTVETHLTSSYRKLGIRRRGELRGALRGEKQDGSPSWGRPD